MSRESRLLALLDQGLRLWADGGRLRFRAPRGVLSQKLRQELGERKADLLAVLDPPGTCYAPTSFGQERLWLLDQLLPSSSAYIIATARRLSGKLRTAALERALGELRRRHEALRTTFTAIDGRPAQVIAAATPVPLPVIDLTALAPAPRTSELEHLVAAEVLRPMDLARGPLLRAALLRLDREEHLLLLTIHHIVADGWSLGTIDGELSALYNAFATGVASPLAEPPLQYADAAARQRRELVGEALATPLAYWRQRLGNDSAPCELPADRQRDPRTVAWHGGTHRFELSGDLCRALESLGRGADASLYMTLLAVFFALLHRLTGGTDILIGSPVVGRQRQDEEGTVGFFVNTLVMRADLAGEASFLRLLEQVRTMALGAYAHQQIPFEVLVAELDPERDASRNPFFQITFALQNQPRKELGLQGLEAQAFTLPAPAAKFDLEMILKSAGDGLAGYVVYRRDLFDRTTMARLAAGFEILCRGAAEHPQRHLSKLPLLTAGQRQQLLVEWNDSHTLRPACRGLHRVFEAQAERAPEAAAVVFREQTLSYRQLHREARRLARRLQASGVASGEPVGLLAQRCPEMVIAVLGILEAGAAYLPLDPGHPAERQQMVLADARVRLVITLGSRTHRLPPTVRPIRLVISEPALEVPPSTETPIRGDALAYVIYTSGSTGRPKGVMVSHRAIVNSLLWMQATFPLQPDDRVLQHTPLSFDASIWEVFSPLLAGASVVLTGSDGHRDSREQVAAVSELGITVLQQVPTLLRLFLQEAGERRLPTLRRLFCGGEKLESDLVRRSRELFDGEVINLYGPTEAAIDVSSHRCRPESQEVPVGRPIANVRLLLLDRALRPVPVGVDGELVASSAGLARGYLRAPARTSERFVPDPWSDRPGARLYRTGDLARQRPDGEILFLGRLDQQLKIRGHRIEPGEIEAVLVEHPRIRRALVLAHHDRQHDGGLRLVACVVPRPPVEPKRLHDDELRGFLSQRLPWAMIPATFVPLARLPLTTSGKLDRAAAARAAREHLQRPASRQTRAAPRRPEEELLAAIWCRVLGRGEIEPHESFFDLGGHSLLATQLLSRVRRVFGVELPLKDLFEAPTVAGLMARIKTARRAGRGRGAPPLVMARRDERPLPLSFAQQRLWFLAQLEPDSPAYNLSAAYQLSGDLDVDALARALGEIVRRHEALRTTFTSHRGRPRQRIATASETPLPLLDLTGLPATARRREAERQAQAAVMSPFRLDRAPLLRCRLLRLGKERHMLLFTCHHIIADGWSMMVFQRELAVLYDAFRQRRPSPLAKLPVQYADFARWQRRWLRGEVLAKQLAYWRRQLTGAPSLTLPIDRPRPPILGYRGAAHPSRFDSGLTAALRRQCVDREATLFMGLLAAFWTLLYRFSGQRDVVVGSPIANRRHQDVERLIGFFVNSLVLRGDLSPAAGGALEPTFQELLGRARDVALGAYAHQDLPFEKLVEELRPERRLDLHPFFQVSLALQSAPGDPVELDGLTLRPTRVATRRVRFDLELYLWQTSARGDAPELHGSWIYNTAIFDSTTIARLAAGFDQAVHALGADPGRRISQVPVMARAARHQLLVEWNDSQQGFPAIVNLHAMFEARATQSRDAVAVLAPEGQLSYRELERRANRLGRRLRRLGVGAEMRAAICMERRLDLVIALLGILEAGGTYVPLDPDDPPDRLAWLVADCRASVVVTEDRRRGCLAQVQVPVLSLDEDEEVASLHPRAQPLDGVGAKNAAYLLYTSGSTGRPKAVVISHHAICHHMLWMQHALPLSAGDRVLQKTPVTFDASVWEFWAPLFAGGCLILAKPGEHRDPAALGATLCKQRVSILQVVPSLLRILLAHGRLETCRDLRRVVCGGERLDPGLRDRFFATGIDADLYNVYGPTEATIHASFSRCRPSIGSPVTLGREIANTRICLFDANLRPVPAGVAGELCISGPGLARGYFDRPALSAERFVPDPNPAAGAGCRLYRSGDLARYRGDGGLEFLGRIDQQIKIRGYRIEPEEIEVLLSRHPAVLQVVVTSADGALAAWVVPAAEWTDDAATASADQGLVPRLRRYLARRLPDYMRPSRLMVLSELPRTATGKVDRVALARRPIPAADRHQATPGAAPSPGEAKLAPVWAEVLGLEEVGAHENFFDLGGHSLLLVRLQDRLQRLLGRELPIVELFQHPTIASLARHLGAQGLGPEPPSGGGRAHRQQPAAEDAIAVIGMSGRFPGSSNLEDFWRNLRSGRESISSIPAPAGEHDSHYVGARGVLEGAELFDAELFAFSPREAAITDPQHRLFLECAWEALENAGYDPRQAENRIGVFAGSGRSTGQPVDLAALDPFELALGFDTDHLAMRASYKLDLRGPALSVQTACSTSLVAVHLACRSLLHGECELALAGGVSLTLPQRMGYVWRAGGILSPDGHCRAFDARAAGTVTGSGAGIVVLKPLERALADGDRLRAVIRGSAVNNDGAAKVGYTAPSVAGQARVIADAQAAAGVAPATVDYVEAHGTGTPLGDPIEVAALNQTFGGEQPRRSCAIGSVKTNVGHLGAAAGVAGLIKTILALEHRQIPPSLHFERPNPDIDFEAGPFYVNTELRPWPRGATPRRAGVSSFSMGGTNAHVIVEEAATSAPSEAAPAPYLLVLSAKTTVALEAATKHLASHLREVHPESAGRQEEEAMELADTAYTLQVGRQALDLRRVVVADDAKSAANALTTLDSRRVFSRRQRSRERPVVFLFPGQGAQVLDMGRKLYAVETVFRHQVDRCCELLTPALDLDLRQVLFPAAVRRGEAGHQLACPSVTQAALFTVEYALAKLWMSWGVEPHAMLGHSLGELVAACLAGVFDLPQALELLSLRGRLIEALPAGGMLSVPLPASDLAPRLSPELGLAAVNAPGISVVSGPTAAIEALAGELSATGVGGCRRLAVHRAFHSPMVQPIVEPFAKALEDLDPEPPQRPWISNVTGTWIRPDEATDPSYWIRHLRSTVRFADGLGTLLEEEGRILLEVGPGRTLATLVRQHPAASRAEAVLSSLPAPEDGENARAQLITALGRLWLAGGRVDWPHLYAGRRRRRVALPTYPFERRLYRLEPDATTLAPRCSHRSIVAGVDQAPSAAGATPSTAAASSAPENPSKRPRRPDLDTPYTPPGTELESRLAGDWQELLGIDLVGVDDDFFELGGHSLLATRMLSRLRHRECVELTPRQLFDASTVAELARVVAAAPSLPEHQQAMAEEEEGTL